MVIVSDPTCNAESPLLHGGSGDSASVDYLGRPVSRSSSGGWRSASFIIGVEVAERFANNGISSNLISYLTGPLGQSTATAAENVNIWGGTTMLLPLVGAFVADSFFGRYRTIFVASLIYVLGLSLLTLSVTLPSLTNPRCHSKNTELRHCSPPKLQVILFFFSLYLVSIGLGGHKPCVQTFGADQFDGQDEEERKAKSSFFNWWYFGIAGGSMASIVILNYIQEYLSWGLGFGIPCLVMMAALLVFLLGTKTYRYSVIEDEKSPFGRIGRALASAVRNWRKKSSLVTIDEEARGTQTHQGSEQFNEALLSPDCSVEDDEKVCSTIEVKEARSILRLIPIWTTCLVYAVVLAQISTFFTKQGATMDRSIARGITIPAASLQSVIALTVLLLVPIYDAVLVPAARALTGKPSGITMLQRIGTGLFLSIITMAAAAIVEAKRLRTARNHHLLDPPNATIPMRIWWLLPQYVLLGVADVFAIVGMHEFFYDQVPDELRSIGLSFGLSIFGFGAYLSGFLVSAIEGATGGDGRESWFSDNLNRAHLDYFYWLLAGLSSLGFAGFLCLARCYVYSKKGTVYSI